MHANKLIGLIVLSLFSLNVFAEGSYQTGLNQPFTDYASSNSPLYLDIIAAGEVINVSLCGNAIADDVRVQIFDPDNISVLDTTLTDGNVACDDPFTAPLTSPIRHTTTKTGAYEIRLDNINGSVLRRFDVSVTPDAVTNPDPTIADGRLWAYKLAFNAGDYTEGTATDADYYPLVPGGRAGTNYVWKLDLNKFAGFVYDIVANDLGVAAPNSGYSVPTSGNSVTPKFPIYMGYPDIALARPMDPPVISDFRFIDNAGQDYAISPGTTTGVQDSGNFEFTSDADGTYSITIDTNRDGVFGTGDKLLLGVVTAGVPAVVPWNGTDAAGATLPAGTYRAELEMRLGEYHFIANDAETSGGTYDGLTIYVANSDGSTSDTLVYWDDATLLGATSTLPNGELSSSPAGKHTWGNFTGTSIGNAAYIDTYVYGLTSSASSLTAISSSDAPLMGDDGVLNVSPANAAPGGSFDITVTDADLNTINGVQEGQFIVVNNPRTGEVEQISLSEAGINASSFISSFTTQANSSAGTNNDGSMNVQLADVLTIAYYDQLDSTGGSATRTANITITDGDSIPAGSDLDDDNDGIPDALEGDGAVDTDGDGIPDSLDLDSDNDGIYDLHESGANAALLDLDNDGRIDPSNPVGSNGLADAVETSADSGVLNYNSGAPLDTDGDTVYDFRDLDSDNDGIPDVIEAGGSDADGDGLIGTGVPAVDGNGVALSGAGLTPPDTDGDGATDQLDLDSDNDTYYDLVEAGGTDGDNNGMVDGFTDANGDGFDDGLAASPLPLTDSNGDGTPDYKDNTDTDSDGIPNSIDLDDDNDGIPDSLEGDGSVDTDGDGIADSLDLDSDNDGLFDVIESGITNPETLDANNDGRIDSSNSVGSNGLADAVETGVDSGTVSYNSGAPLNSDGDTVADFRDLDTDNDGIPDVIEANGSDSDGDGIVGTGTPTVDANGVATSGAGLISPDTDGDNVIDTRDLDSDGDGLYDLVEAGGADTDNNGLVDGFTDSNNDGFDDGIAASGLSMPDTDGDGVVDRLDLDSDNDGITDVIESGGTDPNGDGRVGTAPQTVDASGVYTGGALVPLDTDGDGVANQHDLDSDNDGIPDVLEAGGTDGDGDGIVGTGTPTVNGNGVANGVILNPADTDGDSFPDFRDLDSDGDGIYDLVEAGGNDSDNNGLVDGFVDANGDGFDDFTTSTALPLPDADGDGIPDYQDNDDTDNDGVPDSIDLDDDNDGIPDSLEGDGLVDTDGDGIVDSLDLDSDNDGLFDLIESGITNPQTLDTDNDGRIDATNPVGSNGLADVIETSADSGSINYNSGAVIDTDNDGVADFRDLDSDNDGIPDVIEAGGNDGDGDGVIGTGTPSVNINGLASGSGLVEIDTDTDGQPDHRDLDSDNDGIFDLKEVGGTDADNDGLVDGFVDADGDGFDDNRTGVVLTLSDADRDGIPDFRDTDPVVTEVIHTGLDGIGQFNLWLLMLFAPLIITARRYSGKKLLAFFSLLAITANVNAAEAEQGEYQRRVYIGAGVGYSLMEPETAGTIYTIDDDNDFGARVYLGFDFNPHISAELSLSKLGTVTLQPVGEIDYDVTAFNALYYFYDQGENDHVGFASYLKAGLGKINNSATVPYVMDNDVQVSFGIGAEYAWENGFAVRGDLESFDDDAAMVTVGLLYRFGKQEKSKPVEQTTPKDTDGDGVYDELDQCPGTLTGITVDAQGCELDTDQDGVVDSKDQCPSSAPGEKVNEQGCSLDTDGDGVVNALDQCPDTIKGASVNAVGCAIFEAKIEGINFKVGSAELTDDAKSVLNKAADALVKFSSVRIGIQAHTDSQGKKEQNQKLSEARAVSVADYLESKGVSRDRMEAQGFGESQPLASNKTAEGRAQNRRVEFRVLQAESKTE